jgi:predicted alpha/beta-hydrolase family hydrolase
VSASGDLVLAHGGGAPEAAMIGLPILLFVVFFLMERRARRREDEEEPPAEEGDRG